MNKSDAGKLGYLKTKNVLDDHRERQKKECRLREKEYDQNPSICLKCGLKLPYAKRKQTFCSHSCSASYRNKGVTRHGQKPFNCRVCGKKLHQSSRKYCSHKCYQFDRCEKVKEGIENGSVKLADTNRSLSRKYLKDKHGEKCSICKNTEWMGKPIPLVLDHIDGHHENNELDNLRLVCGNCDMQLPTYKARNKGNGRQARK